MLDLNEEAGSSIVFPSVFTQGDMPIFAEKQDALNRLSVVTATCSTLPSFSLIHLVLLLRLSYLCSQRLFSLSLATIISPQVRTNVFIHAPGKLSITFIPCHFLPGRPTPSHPSP
ncbi:hypothetical protein VPH35_136822 [Triticum aestivum]|uniref:Uncharacterized protein n=1 Tax=Aegilops tauschii subsp. strangulata TaxID=200361 RepID=A0A453RHK5_AEGTS